MKDFSLAFKKATAEKVCEFLEEVTITKTAFAGIFKISGPVLSMIKNDAHFPNITSDAWRLFADIANKKIYVESHFIKDCRGDGEPIMINMLEYQTKHGRGRNSGLESKKFNKEEHSNATVVAEVNSDPVPPAEKLTLEQEKLLKILKNNPDVKAHDIISVYNKYYDYEPPPPTPKRSAISEEDIEQLKKFGMNFKRGIYLVHEDTVVELMSPVDLHNVLSQIIRVEFDRCIKEMETTLWVIKRGRIPV